MNNMPTSQAVRDTDIEKQIDTVLEREQTARDEEARAAVRVRVVEEQRLALEEEVRRRAAAARAAFLARAQALHGPACTRYKTALAEFRAARLDLQALDIILDRQGFGHSLGIELRHSCAAAIETDLNNDLPAAVDAMRRSLGG